MNKNKLIAGSLIALSALFLAGCSNTSSAPVETQTVYVEPSQPAVPELTVEEQYILHINSFDNYYISTTSDADLVSLGKQTCTVLDSGYTIEELVNDFATSSSFTEDAQFEFIGLVIGSGIKFFCPEYMTEAQAALA
jgi:PBP1b-binding outer membrane lipoprotein LpoB